MQVELNNKPCLVETRQGLSVLYKNRYLYSKYNPAANIERLIDSLSIRRGTLILCFSPILGYGIEKLAQKLPADCFMLIIEADKNLLELYNQFTIPEKIGFLGPKRLEDLYNLLTKKNQITDNGEQIPHPGTFRHCQRVDFSASPSLLQEKYQQIYQHAELAVSNFWKNRLTLIKMGRLYHRNMMRNLALTPYGKQFPLSSITNPILVLGAGPSVDKTISEIKKLGCQNTGQRKTFCVLAVDAVVSALLAQDIVPDFVLALECQHAIQQAYTTASNTELFLLADLTSRPSILHRDTATGQGKVLKKESPCSNCTSGDTAFFLTEFAGTSFIERLQQKDFIHQIFPPLGSVGIAAVELAMFLRADNSVPILVSGLDFSFSLDRTHCKESFQTKRKLRETNRLHPLGAYTSLNNPTTEKVDGKSGFVYTDKILSYYNKIFINQFQKATNIFDIGKKGVHLGLQQGEISQFISEKNTFNLPQKNDSTITPQQILDFYNSEEAMLKELKEGLISGNIRQERIMEILEEADYLYLHFPDGYKPSLDTSFLKRVRAEIDFFLKDIAIGKKITQDQI